MLPAQHVRHPLPGNCRGEPQGTDERGETRLCFPAAPARMGEADGRPALVVPSPGRSVTGLSSKPIPLSRSAAGALLERRWHRSRKPLLWRQEACPTGLTGDGERPPLEPCWKSVSLATELLGAGFARKRQRTVAP